jgi:glucose/arabinose dehydrogenase
MPTPSDPPMRARVRLPAAVAAIAILVAACGSSGTPAPAASASGPPPSAVASSSPSQQPSATATASSSGRGNAASTGPFDPKGLKVGFDTVVDGLDSPLAIANAGDGSKRLFVAEQGGRIRIVKDGKLQDGSFLDVGGEITTGGERGLLGFAFHPGYPTDPRVFVDYTDAHGDTQVSSFTVDPSDPDRLDPSSEVKILFVKQPYANHNGGALAFGPDGMLYISLGDGGSGGDPQGNGQSLQALLGKILRIDVDRTANGRPYAIPPDNPFAGGGSGARQEIWLVGLRNPWRMSFDRATGDLWIGDVGQNAWEEIDVVRAGAAGGINFGWNAMEGRHCFQPSTGCENAAYTLPVTEYGHDQGCTVIGGYVDRGTSQPALAGGYLFADYCSGRVWAIDPTKDSVETPTVVAETSHSFSAFGEDEAGELYATDIGGGQLLKVTGSRG